MSNKKPSPYKGIPKADWPGVRAAAAAVGKLREDLIYPEEDLHSADHPSSFSTDAAQALVGEVSMAAAQTGTPERHHHPDPRHKNVPSAEERANSVPRPSAPVRNLFSGQIKNLEVFGIDGNTTDPLPGYWLYWITDEGGTGTRLNAARTSGYEFVRKDEIAMQDNLVEGNGDIGTVVRKVVNKRTTPVEYGYLMKKPIDLHREHQAEMAAVNDRQEAAIGRGAFNAKPEDGRYTAGDVAKTSMPKIEISTSFKRPV